MKKLILFVCCSFLTDISTAQRVEFFGGIEFSKPLFSDKNYSNPGAIVGVAFENFFDKDFKDIKYILEFSVNHVLTIDTRSYQRTQLGDLNDYLIVDQEFYYTSFEFAFLVKFKNLFGEGLPFIYSGLSLGIGTRGVESKERNPIPGIGIMYLLDYTETPYTFPLSLDAGLSYSLNDYWDVDLRYKITNPILDDEYFTQNVYLVIHMKLN